MTCVPFASIWVRLLELTYSASKTLRRLLYTCYCVVLWRGLSLYEQHRHGHRHVDDAIQLLSIYEKPSRDKVPEVNVETKLGVEYSLQFYSLLSQKWHATIAFAYCDICTTLHLTTSRDTFLVTCICRTMGRCLIYLGRPSKDWSPSSFDQC